MPTKNIECGSGTIIIRGQKFTGAIKDFTFDDETADDNIRGYIRKNMRWSSSCITMVRIDKITLLELIGLWQCMLDNCPNGRVKYLMQHGSKRTRLKNYKRACKLLGRIVKEVK